MFYCITTISYSCKDQGCWLYDLLNLFVLFNYCGIFHYTKNRNSFDVMFVIVAWLPKYFKCPGSMCFIIMQNTFLSSDGLMEDMTSKNISSCTVSYTALPMKTDFHFQPTFPTDFIQLFVFFFNSSKLHCIYITFSKISAHSKDVHKDQYIYQLWVIIEGTLVIVYEINGPLWYKTTCCESESRKFECQWTLVSFFCKT